MPSTASLSIIASAERTPAGSNEVSQTADAPDKDSCVPVRIPAQRMRPALTVIMILSAGPAVASATELRMEALPRIWLEGKTAYVISMIGALTRIVMIWRFRRMDGKRPVRICEQ